MESKEIDDPLKPVPFKRLNIGQVEQVHEHVRRKASIKGVLENAHFSPRSAELRWNKALGVADVKEEEPIEPEHDIPGEKVLPPAE